MSEQGSGEGKRFLNAKQVAARYGMTTQWVYSCPEMKAIRRRIGKYLFYAEADLEVLEKTDRDKATGGKTAPLDWCRKVETEKLETKLKFTFK